MPPSLVVGCPIYKRARFVPYWFFHVQRACEKAGITPEYAFILDENDTNTVEAIGQQNGYGYAMFVQQPERQDVRDWGPDRYRFMAEIRNHLLRLVRVIDPDYFLSLDSDILLHEDAVVNLLESVQGWDACGGKAYMTKLGTHFPSYAMFTSSNHLLRRECSNVMPVDVIMAIKLMSRSAYHINYETHNQGEDIGWSLACRKAGLKLRWDGRVVNKHCMEDKMLHTVDNRVGF